jgi:ribosomal protein S18 acetylase RimI-like enzyme
MLVDVKARLNDDAVREILLSAVSEDPDRLDQVIMQYRNDDHLQIMGYETDGEMVAVIGYRLTEDGTLDIRHIAVSAEERGMGFGRGIILHVLDRVKPKLAAAETDEDTVDFYRNIGFTVQSLGERYPGTERFKCTFLTDF